MKPIVTNIKGVPLLTLALLLAQDFSLNPPGAPPVAGALTERAILRSVEIRPGTGDPALPGQEYTVHYTGWLRDGTKFDSSVDRHQPLVFIQGRRHVIAGFDNAYEGMRARGQRRIFIPYQLAYGENGRGAIPPKAELIFDVELLSVRNVPAEQAAQGILVALNEYAEKLLALAQAIPEEKYNSTPAPHTRPLHQVLAHVAYGNRLMLDLSEKMPPAAELKARLEQQGKQEREPHTKAQLIQMLAESFAAVRKQAEPLRAAQLTTGRDFFGQQTNLHGVYTLLISHAAEHLGQLIVYARTLGVAPPWSTQ